MAEKYLGCVRFYKHLYIICFASLLIVPCLYVFYCLQVSMAAVKPLPVTSVHKADDPETGLPAGSGDYREKYPELFALPVRKQSLTQNTVYLTFDDGPSPVTEGILDVLEQCGVKGTFFVVGSRLHSREGKDILRRIVREGHSLGIHSDTHRYRKIYASVEAWLDDFAAVHQKISDITGRKTDIFRFPGGSINIYNTGLYQELIAEMIRRGYVYFDWNVSVGDISPSPMRAETLFANAVARSPGDGSIVILMHDSATKTETLKALPKIIEHYRSRGFSFDKLQNSTYPITFGYGS